MSEVAAHAATLLISLGRCAGHAGVIVVEGDALVDKIADRLNARGARLGMAEEPPGEVEQTVVVAEPARQQKNKALFRQPFDRYLASMGVVAFRQAAIGDDCIGSYPHKPLWRHQSGAPVAEAITVATDAHRGLDADMVRFVQVRNPAEMHIQHQDDGCRLREIVVELVADPEFHAIPSAQWREWRPVHLLKQIPPCMFPACGDIGYAYWYAARRPGVRFRPTSQ